MVRSIVRGTKTRFQNDWKEWKKVEVSEKNIMPPRSLPTWVLPCLKTFGTGLAKLAVTGYYFFFTGGACQPGGVLGDTWRGGTNEKP